MKKIITLALILAASSTWATGRNDPDQEQQQGQHQDQGQDQTQGQDQLQTQETIVTTEASIAEGAVQVNNVREAQGDYKVDFRNNPNVYTNPPNATITCYKTGGGGASGGGVGLSFGGGKIDPYCVEREEIRLAHMIGMNFQAVWRWCNLENNIAVFGSPTECIQADTSLLSEKYQLLLKERDTLRNRLEETETVLLRRCQEAEEGTERATEAWLECQAGK